MTRSSGPALAFRSLAWLAIGVLAVTSAGCAPGGGRSTAKASRGTAKPSAKTSAGAKPQPAPTRPPRSTPEQKQRDRATRPRESRSDDQADASPPPSSPPRNRPRPQPDPDRSLADLLSRPDVDVSSGSQPLPALAASNEVLPISDTQASVAGIRKLRGTHLTLYTDVPPLPDVDELPAVFDQAVPQWGQYFEIAPARLQDWRMTGFLIREKARFQGVGMIPANLPPFTNGYQRGLYFWLYDQPTDYYRRHLLLHEGTHGFMDNLLGGLGPPWYGEGLAELLGTHRWKDGQLTLGYVPRNKKETPGWGRIRIVKDELAAGHGKMPDEILNYGPTAHLQNAPYGWCWAWATFLDGHPQTQTLFRGLRKTVTERDLTPRFRQQLQPDWATLCEEWQLFVMNLDYGYDVARAAIVRKPGLPLPDAGTEVTIAADRGWQSTGVRLEAGLAYRLEAHGRYQVGQTDQPWWCEPGGVTLHYNQGQPLGLLLAALREDGPPPAGLTPLARPEVIGTARDWTPTSGGTLYLRINESAAHLGDNQGQVTLRIQRRNA